MRECAKLKYIFIFNAHRIVWNKVKKCAVGLLPYNKIYINTGVGGDKTSKISHGWLIDVQCTTTQLQVVNRQ